MGSICPIQLPEKIKITIHHPSLINSEVTWAIYKALRIMFVCHRRCDIDIMTEEIQNCRVYLVFLNDMRPRSDEDFSFKPQPLAEL